MIVEFFTATVLAAFLSGAIAFFAPCCVTFLLPSYFSFILKERKQIIKMTLVFMLGLATILIPIGLGLAGLGQLATQFHTQLFIAGGVFLLIVGALTLAGKTLAMPFKPQAPNMQKLDVPAVYQLGLFSGFASSCCLPVLAGVMTLSLISASFFQAFLLGWAYVFGMVAPLVALALLWEKYKLAENPLIKGRNFVFNLFGKSVSIHSTSLVSGAVLILMGILTLYAAFTNKITVATESQIEFALYLQGTQKSVLEYAKVIPDWIFAVILVGAFLLLIKKVLENKKVQ
ncbi:MAG: cytochrome c biogenesis protein CcdA [Candidatus Micrarchaeota archaeon]